MANVARYFAFGMLLCVSIGANSQTAEVKPNIPAPPECLDQAAEFHGVNNWVLRAIIWHESLNNPSLVLRNKNGSVDVGYGGINSIHYRDLGAFNVNPDQLLDGCVNTYVAAWLLKKKINRHGDTWDAIGAYHSETPDKKKAYAERIRRVLTRWRVI